MMPGAAHHHHPIWETNIWGFTQSSLGDETKAEQRYLQQGSDEQAPPLFATTKVELSFHRQSCLPKPATG
jgi:hypothetical protein